MEAQGSPAAAASQEASFTESEADTTTPSTTPRDSSHSTSGETKLENGDNTASQPSKPETSDSDFGTPPPPPPKDSILGETMNNEDSTSAPMDRVPTISLTTDEAQSGNVAHHDDISQEEGRQTPASPSSSRKSIQGGIPLPISIDQPSESPDRRGSVTEPPKSPSTPTRTSSRNAPTTVNPQTGRVAASSLAQSSSTGQVTISSMVFVVQALETIGASREAKRRKQLTDAVQAALNAIRESAPEPPADPTVIYEPLRIACTLSNTQVVREALDCIGKLISYSYFSIVPPHLEGGPDQPPLIERAIETVSDCFQGEATPSEIQLQIVKGLLAAVLNDKMIVHGAGLMKAVRQTYNIFLLSRDTSNQMTAQTTLTQMVNTVFDRVETRLEMKEARQKASKSESSLTVHIPNGDGATETKEYPETPMTAITEEKSTEKITLQSFENRKSFDDDRITESEPTTITPSPRRPPPSHSDTSFTEHRTQQEDEDEVYVKDAFLVFRAMCKLAIKVMPAEQIADLRSFGMRSRLLALHLIRELLLKHMKVFISPLSTIRSSSTGEATGFVHAIKQYLCLSLSRNAASAVSHVFEVCCEIFWLLMKNMRVVLKKEIEVFLKEIYFNVLDNKHSSVQQKQALLSVLERVCADPRALVEFYLNYDCDDSALDNMYQRIIEHLARIATTHVPITDLQLQQYPEQQKAHLASSHRNQSTIPLLSTNALGNPHYSHLTIDPAFPVEYMLKRDALNGVIEVLRSLVAWSQKDLGDAYGEAGDGEETRESSDHGRTSPRPSTVATPVAISTPSGDSLSELGSAFDDPNQLEKVKQRKTALNEAIRIFNFKPKRGIKALLSQKFIESDTPEHIAKFLLHTPQLSKAMIGEYLGEGEPENVAIMHAFVDQMDFTRMRFVDALRRFLQSFRLPGEAQKIDRFMLKFAERYISGNPNAFANADTAYVLAYSVIMLNTDQHSDKLKGRERMTREDFIKNNRGINDGADLPEDYLNTIYDEIHANEIILEDEREAKLDLANAAPAGSIMEGIGRVIATAGRDLEREAYVQASEEMANKTEQLFKSLIKAQRRVGGARPSLPKYIAASSSKHVGPMFEVTWMSFLSSLSGAAQESNDVEIIRQCMEGFKLAIRISCLFELETSRIAFLSALAKFTHLNNLSEMKAKNIEALKALLDVAQTEGNLLRSSWRDVLTCISQLERFQLISSGVDEGSVPDVTKGRYVHNDGEAKPRSSMASQRPMRSRGRAQSHTFYVTEVAEEARAREIVIAVDRIFANSSKLNGQAIVHFVEALSEVSWQEIQSSGQSEHPRMFSLQKLVEISYYNMGRIRVEWSSIWNVLGAHFNQVGCHSNTSVVFFALDSLRQLSMRFLEIEELPHFKFQKDFLSPFQYIMANHTVVPVKDMVLRCLSQMLQARGDNITSGWRAMFGTFTIAAKENYDSIVTLAFDNVRQIYKHRFGVIVQQGAFGDMIQCLTEFSKNQRFQKVSLQAIETLKGTVPVMLACPECPLSHMGKKGENPDDKPIKLEEDPMKKYWLPVLYAFHDILMTGEDLEARTRALGYLFDILTQYGYTFQPDFWDVVCNELLFPIFLVLKSRSEKIQFKTQESVGLWLSTTMIQALRNLIALLTHYFEALERLLDGFLDLLITCICQENDTIARIGSSCLQQLILQSVDKLQPAHWEKIVSAFVSLFETTTADALFTSVPATGMARSASSGTLPPPTSDLRRISEAGIEEEPSDPENALKIEGLTSVSTENVSREEDDRASVAGSVADGESNPRTAELEDYRPHSLQQQPVVTAQRRRFFNKIITKCVLQLLMIETVSELFQNDAVYNKIPSSELLRLMSLLKKSFSFARRFNNDKELRMRLWREGFMKQPPNLLKQESGSASTYVSILLRMFHDDNTERRQSRDAIEAALIPLCVDILRGFIVLEEETQHRNIIAWRPVVVDVLEGYTNFPEADFKAHIETFYPLAVEVMGRDILPEVRTALQGLFRRVGEIKKLGVTKESINKARLRKGSVLSMRNGSVSGGR